MIKKCFKIIFFLEKAEVYKNKGNYEYSKKNLSNAIHFYTEGIKVNCKDDELNAKLYSNRAIAHLHLGESYEREFLDCLTILASLAYFLKFNINLQCPCSLMLQMHSNHLDIRITYEQTLWTCALRHAA